LRVRVKFFAAIRELAAIKEETIDLQSNTTVRELIRILCERHGGDFTEYVIDQNTGAPRSHLQILVDGKNLSSLEGLETRLSDGVEVALMPPVGGG
jgi:molybdopterin synthase sulfur carrier subunit